MTKKLPFLAWVGAFCIGVTSSIVQAETPQPTVITDLSVDYKNREETPRTDKKAIFDGEYGTWSANASSNNTGTGTNQVLVNDVGAGQDVRAWRKAKGYGRGASDYLGFFRPSDYVGNSATYFGKTGAEGYPAEGYMMVMPNVPAGAFNHLAWQKNDGVIVKGDKLIVEVAGRTDSTAMSYDSIDLTLLVNGKIATVNGTPINRVNATSATNRWLQYEIPLSSLPQSIHSLSVVTGNATSDFSCDDSLVKAVLTGTTYTTSELRPLTSLSDAYKADMTHSLNATWSDENGTWTVYGSNEIINATTPSLVLNANKVAGANRTAGGYGMNQDPTSCGEISNRTTGFESSGLTDYLRINPGISSPENPKNLVFRWTPEGEQPVDIYFDGFLQSVNNALADGKDWIDFSVVIDGEEILTGFDRLTYQNATQVGDAYKMDFDGFAKVAESIDFVVGSNSANYYSDVTAFGLQLYALPTTGVPEPATGVLLLVGIGGIAYLRSRRMRKNP